MKGPLFAKSIEELEVLFAGADGDQSTLRALEAELNRRSTKRAIRLKFRVARALDPNADPAPELPFVELSQAQLRTEVPVPRGRYEVLVDDNFHYMDESERYSLGEFDSAEAAIAACKSLVDRDLDLAEQPDLTPDEMYERYKSFGSDPFIVSLDPTAQPVEFSAWEYAKERCTSVAAGRSGTWAWLPRWLRRR